MKPPSFLPILILLAAPAGTSQTRTAVEVPRASASTVTRSTAFFWSPAARFQIILPGARLKPIQGGRLTALEFRNWTNPASRIKKGDASLTVKAAPAARPPTRASRVFAANLGGKARLLASQAVHFDDGIPYGGGGPTPWGDPRNLRIALQGDYLYKGGDLLLDMEVRAVPGKPLPFWLGRALAWKIPVEESYFGSPTAGTAPDFRTWVYGSLAPGERTSLVLEGVPAGAPAFLLLGLSNTRFLGFPLPMPAAFSGGRKVFLRTSPDLAFPALAVKYPLPASLKGNPSLSPFLSLQGEAAVVLDFPWDPSYLGGALFAQWFTMGVMGPGYKVENRLASTRGIRLPILSASAHLNAVFLSAESQDPKAVFTRAETSSLRFLPNLRLEARR